MLDKSRLEDEACRIVGALFGGTPEQAILDRYVDAHAGFEVTESPAELRLLAVLMTEPKYIEAVEYVLRLRRQDNVLTKKVKIVHYLVECRASYYGEWFQEKDNAILAWAELVRAFWGTFLCLTRGWYFLKRHRVA